MYDYHATVLRVIDGDTLHVDIDLGFHLWLRDRSIRLAGINCPELKTAAGKIASMETNLHVPPAAVLAIRTTKDPDDKYGGRYDAWVQLPDGRWLNRVLVDGGHAVPLGPLPVDPVEHPFG